MQINAAKLIELLRPYAAASVHISYCDREEREPETKELHRISVVLSPTGAALFVTLETE